MTLPTLLVLLAVVAILFGAAVVATQDNPILVDAPPDDADVDLPTGRVVAEDLRSVRFGMVVRGYRMSEVDAVLARLGGELAARDARITDLERVLAEIVEPVMDELESTAEAVTDVEPPEPVSPPSLTPTLAQGARAGEAPAETPAPAPAADAAGEPQVPASPPSLAPTLAQGARAGEAPAETPSPAPDAADLSPAASFTLPAEHHSLRMPLVEEPSPEPEPVSPEPVADLAEPFGAETLLEPEPEPEPELELELAPELAAQAEAAPAVDGDAPAALETETEDEDEPETGAWAAGLAEPEVVAEEPAGVGASGEEDGPAREEQAYREAAAGGEADENDAGVAAAVAGAGGPVGAGEGQEAVEEELPAVPGGEADDAAGDDFGFPEVLTAEAELGLPDATEDTERDAEVWRGPERLRAAEPGEERPEPPELA